MNTQPLSDYELLLKLASGAPDQFSDCAVEIVQELEREICFRETPWHDCSLSDVVEEILHRYFKDQKENEHPT